MRTYNPACGEQKVHKCVHTKLSARNAWTTLCEGSSAVKMMKIPLRGVGEFLLGQWHRFSLEHDSACQPPPSSATATFESASEGALTLASHSTHGDVPNDVAVTSFTSRFGSAFHNEAADVGSSNTTTLDDMNGHYTLSLPNQGHSCCCCCCDMRRAVFMVDAFYILYALYIVFMRQSNDIDICYRSSYIIGE
jgi:hypothetical protein